MPENNIVCTVNSFTSAEMKPYCAIQLAFACCLRGGEVGGAQWDRFSATENALYIDRVIDRVDKNLLEKLSKMM